MQEAQGRAEVSDNRADGDDLHVRQQKDRKWGGQVAGWEGNSGIQRVKATEEKHNTA